MKREENAYMKSPQPCVFCEHPTEFGSGRFVNRIPAGHYHELDNGKEELREGYACAECMTTECDRCDAPIELDEDYNVDGQGRFHWECLTTKEKEIIESDC